MFASPKHDAIDKEVVSDIELEQGFQKTFRCNQLVVKYRPRVVNMGDSQTHPLFVWESGFTRLEEG